MVGQAANSDATLTDFQAFRVVDAVTRVYIANPVDIYGAAFKGAELLNIAAYINSCR